MSSAALSSSNMSGNAGDVASGSDSDCSSVISSPDDPNHSLLSQPSGSSSPAIVGINASGSE